MCTDKCKYTHACIHTQAYKNGLMSLIKKYRAPLCARHLCTGSIPISKKINWHN